MSNFWEFVEIGEYSKTIEDATSETIQNTTIANGMARLVIQLIGDNLYFPFRYAIIFKDTTQSNMAGELVSPVTELDIPLDGGKHRNVMVRIRKVGFIPVQIDFVRVFAMRETFLPIQIIRDTLL